MIHILVTVEAVLYAIKFSLLNDIAKTGEAKLFITECKHKDRLYYSMKNSILIETWKFR